MTASPNHIDADALKYILSLPQGRKVLWDIFAITGLYHQPFIAGDPETTAMNCGRLNNGLILYKDCMSVSPELTAMMLKEQGTYDNRDPDPQPNHAGDDSGNSDDDGLVRNGLGGFRTDPTDLGNF